MNLLKSILLKHFNKTQNKFVYFYTDHTENVMLMYKDLVDCGINNSGFETPTQTKTFFLFSSDDEGNVYRYDIRLKSYFNPTTTHHVDYNTHDLILHETDDSITFNYDVILRKKKIKRLYNLCLTQFPNIDKFTKDNIYQCKVPRNPTKFFYEDVFNKGVLTKDNLEIGKYYYGRCRNAKVAMWDGSVFIYMRDKWGQKFPEEINHLSDDDGYDLFVPIEKVIPNESEKII